MTPANALRAAPRSPSAGRPMRAAVQRSSPIVAAMLVIVLYFMAYRYPFQISDSGTSPTYADTPTWLQLAKYALLLPLLIAGIVSSRLKSWAVAPVDIAVLVLVAYGSVIGVAVVAGGASTGVKLIQLSFAFLFVILFSEPLVTRANFGLLINSLKMFFYVSLVVYAYHLVNYFLFNRLPALGYYGSFPRFGGVWDDPNSSAAIFMFMLPYALVKSGLTQRTLLIAIASFAAIILSQSLTTFGVVSVTFGLAVPLFFTRVPLTTRLLIVGVGVIVIVVIFAVLSFFVLQSLDMSLSGLIRSMDTILRSKSESVSMRQESYSFVPQINALTLMGLRPVGKFGESEWVNLVANCGLLFTIGFLMFQVATLFQLWRWSRVAVADVRPAVVGLFCYYFWFFLMQTNIPASEVFPINMLSGIVAGVAWAWYASHSVRAAPLRSVRSTARR